MNSYEVFQKLNIPYITHNHPAVFTCEEAEIHCADIPGGKSKNLFLRNRKGDQHYLLIIEASKRADLKKLGQKIDEKLSMASPERMMKWLGCTPGSASILALIHDTEKHIQVMIDKDLWNYEILQYHPPNDNASTLEIHTKDLEKFLDYVRHEVTFIDVPTA